MNSVVVITQDVTLLPKRLGATLFTILAS